MRDMARRHHKLVLEAGVLLLLLAVAVTPAGRQGAKGAPSELVQIVETVTELPCGIVSGFCNFSLDRLDPTCPQCI